MICKIRFFALMVTFLVISLLASILSTSVVAQYFAERPTEFAYSAFTKGMSETIKSLDAKRKQISEKRFRELLRSRVDSYPVIREIQARIQRSQAEVDKAGAVYYPKVTLNPGLGPAMTESKSTDKDGFGGSFSVTAEQFVHDFGLSPNKVKAARQRFILEKANLDLSSEKLVLEMTKSYLDFCKLDFLKQIYLNNTEAYKVFSRMVDQKYQLGVASRLDRDIARAKSIETAQKSEDFALSAIEIASTFRKFFPYLKFKKRGFACVPVVKGGKLRTIDLGENFKASAAHKKALADIRYSEYSLRSFQKTKFGKFVVEGNYSKNFNEENLGASKSTGQVFLRYKNNFDLGGSAKADVLAAKQDLRGARQRYELAKREHIEEYKKKRAKIEYAEKMLDNYINNFNIKTRNLNRSVEYFLSRRGDIDRIFSLQNDLFETGKKTIDTHFDNIYRKIQLQITYSGLDAFFEAQI